MRGAQHNGRHGNRNERIRIIGGKGILHWNERRNELEKTTATRMRMRKNEDE